jgi:protein SCO1
MNDPSGVRRTMAALLAIAALALVTFLLVSGLTQGGLKPPAENRFHGRDVSAEDLGGPFTLPDMSNHSRTLSDFRGKVVLLSFGYTHCPDVCPTTLAKFAQVRRLLGADGARLQVLFVTVDPQRDSAELLRHYLASFDPDFIGLRGTREQTDAVAKSFGARFETTDRQGEIEVDHTASTYVIDANGKTRILTPYDQPARALADDVLALMPGH